MNHPRLPFACRRCHRALRGDRACSPRALRRCRHRPRRPEARAVAGDPAAPAGNRRRSRARAAGDDHPQGRRDRRGSACQREARLGQGHADSTANRISWFPTAAAMSTFVATASTRASGFRCGCCSSSELISLCGCPPEAARHMRAAMPDVGLHTRRAEELEAWLARYTVGALVEPPPIAAGIENTNYLRHDDEGPLRADALRAPAGRRAAVLSQSDGTSRARRCRVSGTRRRIGPARCSAC